MSAREALERVRARKAEARAARERAESERAEILAAAKGDPGDSGETGPMPRHQWRETELRFERAPGKWGQWVDLRGPRGLGGGGGGSSFRPYALPELPLPVDDTDEMIVTRGEASYRISVADLKAVFGQSASGDGTLDGGAASFVYQPSENLDGGSASG